MASTSHSIPEEFADALMNDFAYDPIRLPLSEDPAQVLYNRRTLEKIWDSKQIAVNPYTRQPFNIRNAIPQTELKQQMRQYIIENNRNDLEVIATDYTEVLSSTDMQYLLNELVKAGEHCLLASESNDAIKTEASWKVLWQKLNLLRLYFQYKAENRETFLSIKGYEHLLKVINRGLYSLTVRDSFLLEDAGEACKEVAKIIDVVGLTDSDLQGIPPENISALLHILADLVDKDDLKIHSVVSSIYLGMNDNCMEYVVRGCADTFNILISYVGIYLLLWRRKSTDITNEDLFNVTALLYAAWNRHRGINMQRYVEAVVKVVIICISRLRDLHLASTHRLKAPEGQVTFTNSGHEDQVTFTISGHEDQIHKEEEKNIHMISRALEQGLFLINSVVIRDFEYDHLMLPWKERLQSLDIVKDIVRMVEYILDGCKFFHSTHLQFGLNITALLCRQGKTSAITRKNVVRVFGDFLVRDFVNEYDPQIKLLVQDIVRSVS